MNIEQLSLNIEKREMVKYFGELGCDENGIKSIVKGGDCMDAEGRATSGRVTKSAGAKISGGKV
jgi:hypothetical protein